MRASIRRGLALKTVDAISPGAFLKQLRHQLDLGMRDVREMSLRIAEQKQNRRYYISLARLDRIENAGAVPSQFKAFTFSVVYGIDFNDLLGRYGVFPDEVHRFRSQMKLAATRPVSAEIHSLQPRATIPLRLDPSFKWRDTQLINRAVALWGEIPAAFLMDCNFRQHMYAYIGLEDYTMFPLLRPGSLVMVDGSRRHVAKGGWSNEYQRPIYFIELRDGFVCGWCHVDSSCLTIIPHPSATAAPRTFSLDTEAEVIGQVVSVAMRLVPPSPTNSAQATAPAMQS